MIIKSKGLTPVKRFVILPLALLCSAFMIYALIEKFKEEMIYFGIVFVVVMLIGAAFYYCKKSNKK